jgi:hypothetical protein
VLSQTELAGLIQRLQVDLEEAKKALEGCMCPCQMEATEVAAAEQEVPVPRRGRPLLGSQRMVQDCFRVDPKVREELVAKARAVGLSKNELMRVAVAIIMSLTTDEIKEWKRRLNVV